jgi:glycerophosphoryl diester phosphodiesterase
VEIIEHFTCGKAGQDPLNEDCLVMTDDFIAVLDGVTAKRCPKIDGRSGGRFAVEIASGVIRQFSPGITAREAVNLLTQALQEAVAEKIKLEKGIDAPALCLVIYSRQRREIWRVDDPLMMIDGVLRLNDKVIDKITSGARSFMVAAALEKGLTEDEILRNDIGREFIALMLQEQHFFANKPGLYGYGVINGSFVPDEFIEITDVSAAREIVFSSDGYLQLFPTLKESEDYLAAVLKEDPLLFRKHQSTKGLQPGYVSFDDRTYVRFLTK